MRPLSVLGICGGGQFHVCVGKDECGHLSVQPIIRALSVVVILRTTTVSISVQYFHA